MDTKHISEIVIEALRKTYQNHLSLGEKGKVESGERNSFGQVTYKADLEAGKIFFSSLKKSRLSVKFISEEHGVEVKTGNKPQYLGVIDELDGSNCYKEGVGRYGTTVGIFDNLEPYYKNYLICVILEYTEGKIYYATKNKGGVCLDIGTNKISSIHSSKCSVLNSNKTTAAIDGGWLDANQVFVNALGGFEHLFVGNKANGGASCGYYIGDCCSFWFSKRSGWCYG
jgi:fructose-1,6-bisphosphatase/inositol monophosphatase family enzyme